MNIETRVNSVEASQTSRVHGVGESASLKPALNEAFDVHAGDPMQNAKLEPAAPNLTALLRRSNEAKAMGLSGTDLVHHVVQAELGEAFGDALPRAAANRIARILEDNPAMAQMLHSVLESGSTPT